MLATDLDGTLLRPDNTVSSRTVAALAAARAAGFPVVFVTGRPARWMAPVVEVTGHAGVAVCSNGALLVDLDHGSVLRSHPLAPTVVLTVAAEIAAEVPGTHAAVEFVPPSHPGDDSDRDGMGGAAGGRSTGLALLSQPRAFGHEPAFHPRVQPMHGALVAPLAELVTAGPVVKLLVRAPTGSSPDSLLALAREVIGDRAELTHSSGPQDPLLEISAPGISKGSALAAYAASLGLGSQQVAVAGDMPNDLPMLRWSGAAYAVQGSHPAALAATQGRIAAPADDGLARLLESLLATY